MPTDYRRKNDKPTNIVSKIGNKEYSIIDIENLREANKQMEQLIKKREKLIEQNGKLSDKTMRDHEMVMKMYKSNVDIIDKWNKSMRKAVTNPTDKTDIINSLISNSQNNNKLPKSISDIFTNAISKQQNKEVNEIYNKVAKGVYDKYKKNGADFTDSNVISSMNKEIKDKTLKKIDKTVNKYDKATQIFQLASNTLNTAVKTWVGVATKGFNRQSQVYEDTFTNISVRNGVTRQNYYDAQWKLNNRLSEMGVRNNIASSDVQQMWNTMAKNGLNIDMSTEKARAEVTARAIELVLTKEIVPYLNVESKSFTLLNDKLDGKFVKDIRGISKANLEIAGNNYVTQDLLQTIIDEVQPMSDMALESLAQGSAEVTAMINKLAPIMGEDAAKSYATQLFKTQKYSGQISRSGSMSEKMSLYGAISNGINVYDPTHWNDFIGLAVDNTQLIGSWTPGYNSTLGGVITNSVGDSTGESYDRLSGALNLTAKGLSGSGLANKTNLTPEQYAAYTNAVTNAYKNDTNQTNKKLQDITVENFMNELSVVNDWLGNWAGVLETAIKGIGTILLTKVVGGVIGKGIGALSGISGGLSSAAGIGAALGPIGAVALGIGAIAGTVAIINSKIAQKNQEDVVNTNTGASNKMTALRNQNKSETEVYSAGWTEIGQQNDNGIFVNGGETNAAFSGRTKGITGQWYTENRTFNQYYEKYKTGEGNTNFAVTGNTGDIMEVYSWQDKKFREEMGLTPKAGQSGYTEAHKALQKYIQQNDAASYNKIKAYALRSFIEQNPSIPVDWVLAALSAALITEGGVNDKTILDPLNGKYGFGGTLITDKSTLMSVMAEKGITEADQLGVIYDMLWHNSGVDFWLMREGGTGWMGHPDKATLQKEFNLHRYGLGYVPYDEYPALLHEGEAVLTATTANTLRDLLDEYQQTRHQSINFDSIIQTQTAALVNKMNEIITVIENTGNSSFPISSDTVKARGILNNSMSHMTSTKNF